MIINMADKMAATYHDVVTLKHFQSDFFQISYMNGFHQTLAQVRRMITQMADKMAADYQTQLSWLFSIGFLPNFIYGLVPSNSHSGSNTGFVRRRITKMADKLAAAAYQFALVDTLP